MPLGAYEVKVHDWNPSRLLRKNGWILKRGREHVILSSRELLALFHQGKARLVIKKGVWQRLVKSARGEDPLGKLKERYEREARAYQDLHKELERKRRELHEAMFGKRRDPSRATKLHREVAVGARRLGEAHARLLRAREELRREAGKLAA